MKTTATKTAATVENGCKTAKKEVASFKKRIGSVTYEVSVRFNETSKETMEDKLLRLVRREVNEVA